MEESINKRETKEESKLERKYHRIISNFELQISDFEGRIHQAKKFFEVSNFDLPDASKRSKFPDNTIDRKLAQLLDGDIQEITNLKKEEKYYRQAKDLVDTLLWHERVLQDFDMLFNKL